MLHLAPLHLAFSQSSTRYSRHVYQVSRCDCVLGLATIPRSTACCVCCTSPHICWVFEPCLPVQITVARLCTQLAPFASPIHTRLPGMLATFTGFSDSIVSLRAWPPYLALLHVAFCCTSSHICWVFEPCLPIQITVACVWTFDTHLGLFRPCTGPVLIVDNHTLRCFISPLRLAISLIYPAF